MIGARSEQPSMISDYLHFALGALLAERELHYHFLQKEISADYGDLTPSSIGYTHYLIAIAQTASLEEAVAATLPCFWIYLEVGHALARMAAKPNSYIRWIETYSDEEFAKGVELSIGYFDDLAAAASPNTLKRMEAAFKNSTIFEWHFWNDAYEMNRFSAVHQVADEIFPVS